jgi:hypothetical protein
MFNGVRCAKGYEITSRRMKSRHREIVAVA